MAIRVLAVLMIVLSIVSGVVIKSKSSAIEDLNTANEQLIKDVQRKDSQIAQYKSDIDSQAKTINDLVVESQEKEKLIAKHSRELQKLNLFNQSVEEQITEVISNDQISNDWANTLLPDDVKRVFEYATQTRSDNSQGTGEGLPTCTSDGCMPATIYRFNL